MPAAPLVRSNPCACSARRASNQRFAGRTRTYSPLRSTIAALPSFGVGARWRASRSSRRRRTLFDGNARWHPLAPRRASAGAVLAMRCALLRLPRCGARGLHPYRDDARRLAVSAVRNLQRRALPARLGARPHAGNPRFSPLVSRATRRSRELGMYRQNYCGCRFSAAEAALDRARLRDERRAAKKH